MGTLSPKAKPPKPKKHQHPLKSPCLELLGLTGLQSMGSRFIFTAEGLRFRL